MKKQITVVEHEGDYSADQEKEVKRVAAYCRVSTIQEEQELSYESQYEYFTKLIEGREDMELVGVFGDHGISGLQAKKRPQLQKMMELVREGKIDMVLVKAISRLARNAIDLQNILLEMKKHHVVVFFEKEGIYSNDPQCEMVVKFLAAVAQEESNSISQNIQWSHERSNKLGHPTRACPYGYRKKPHKKGEDHVWEIFEPEATLVRFAFEQAQAGLTRTKIAEKLNKMQKKHPEAKQKKWASSTVSYILRNEAYTGDLITSKTYTLDYLTKTRVKNTGAKEQYFLEDHHPAIISRKLFNEVNPGYEFEEEGELEC